MRKFRCTYYMDIYLLISPSIISSVYLELCIIIHNYLLFSVSNHHSETLTTMIYQYLSWPIMIYSDPSWSIMIYHDLSLSISSFLLIYLYMCIFTLHGAICRTWSPKTQLSVRPSVFHAAGSGQLGPTSQHLNCSVCWYFEYDRLLIIEYIDQAEHIQ